MSRGFLRAESGDSDTLACITGSIAEAFYGGVPEPIAEHARRLMEVLAPTLLEVADAFAGEYMEWERLARPVGRDRTTISVKRHAP